MTKLSLRTLDSVTNNDTTATALINENFRNVQAAIENTLSRDGSVPNYMDANFDLNSKRIINLGDPVDDHDAITKKYFTDTIGDAASYATAAAVSANSAASSAQSSAVSAAQAISELQQAEATINAAVQQAVNTASGQAAADIANYVNTVVEPNLQNIANMAQGYSNNSSNYANLAMVWASQPSGTVDGSEYSAKYYAGLSKDWTNVAHNYSNSSSNYANNSSNYANSSLEYANNSSNYANSSLGYANSSSNYANSSLGYANNSSNYANNASIWAEGTDEEVAVLGGQHSAEGWANVASSLTADKLKTDLSNATATGKATAAGWGMPNRNAGVVKNASWTATSNGWVYVNVTGGNGELTIKIGGVTVASFASSSSNVSPCFYFPIKKGESFSYTRNSGDYNLAAVYFYPCIGG